MDAPADKCPACGNPLQAEEAACPSCGLNLDQSTHASPPLCLSCGGLLSEDAKECPWCGLKQSEEDPTEVHGLRCSKCGAEYREGFTLCPDCHAELVPHLQIPQSNKPYDWRAMLKSVGAVLAVGVVALVVLAWIMGDIYIPYDESIAKKALVVWVPRVLVIAFIGAWVFFLRKIFRRRRLKKKYPCGFSYNGTLYIPLSREQSHETVQTLPEIDCADARLISALSLSQDPASFQVVRYDDALPDMGDFHGGP